MNKLLSRLLSDCALTYSYDVTMQQRQKDSLASSHGLGGQPWATVLSRGSASFIIPVSLVPSRSQDGPTRPLTTKPQVAYVQSARALHGCAACARGSALASLLYKGPVDVNGPVAASRQVRNRSR